MPNAAALWTLLRAAHHHNVAVEQACRERMPRHHEQAETHELYLDESESPDDPATPEQPESPWDCVLRKVAEVILKRVHGAGASTEAALHDQKNLEGVCEKLRGHYEPLMKATSRRQPGEKVCEERCEQDESNAKDKETENLSKALADDIREVFAIERLCDGLDLSRNWEITLPGEGQRLLDDLFLLLESRGWTAKTVADFQAAFPAVAAEMKLAELVQTAPAAGSDTPAARGNAAVAEEMLFGWGEILEVVGRPNERADRDRILRLNQKYDGPIIPPVTQGGQPTVKKQALIHWWNQLSARMSESQAEDRSVTIERDCNVGSASQHSYGRDATVIPEIGGSVRKRKVTKRND